MRYVLALTLLLSFKTLATEVYAQDVEPHPETAKPQMVIVNAHTRWSRCMLQYPNGRVYEIWIPPQEVSQDLPKGVEWICITPPEKYLTDLPE